MKKSLMFGMLCCFSVIANATPYQCTVDINGLLVYSSGLVNVKHSGRGDYTVICNLKEDYQGVSVTTCAMWTSMLLTMKNATKKVDFYYDNQYGSCAALPTYGSSPVPIYIGPSS